MSCWLKCCAQRAEPVKKKQTWLKAFKGNKMCSLWNNYRINRGMLGTSLYVSIQHPQNLAATTGATTTGGSSVKDTHRPLRLMSKASCLEWDSVLARMNITTWSWVCSEMSRPLMSTSRSPSRSLGSLRPACRQHSRHVSRVKIHYQSTVWTHPAKSNSFDYILNDCRQCRLLQNGSKLRIKLYRKQYMRQTTHTLYVLILQCSHLLYRVFSCYA